jgi:hypothetical protein
VSRPDFDVENFCSKECAGLYAILSKHGCNLISADEALKELAAYNIDEITLTEDILAHIEKIKSEAGANIKATTPAEEVAVEPMPIIEEAPIVKSNKKNKKKW